MEGKEEEGFYFTLLLKGTKYYAAEIVAIISGFKYKSQNI